MAQACAAASQSTLTHLAAQRLERIRHTELQDPLCLLDYLGALVSGSSAPWASALLQYAQSQPSLEAEGMHVVGLDRRVSAEVAAFTNASICSQVCWTHAGKALLASASKLSVSCSPREGDADDFGVVLTAWSVTICTFEQELTSA